MNDMLAAMGPILLAGKTQDLTKAVAAAMDAGVPAKEILDRGLVPVMNELGERFSRGDAFLPELLLAGDTMKSALEVLRPSFVKSGIAPAATMVIGTVEGDIHDLGKNIVKMMFEGAGFRVVDLGINVTAAQFAKACAAEKADLIGLSSLITSTMAGMERIIREVRRSQPQAKFIVGGAPLSQAFAERIGANGYAPDAHLAVKVGRAILGLDGGQ